MKNIRSVAVFCGSSKGNDEKYVKLAADFGRKCAGYGLTVYYGGAKLGLMGAVAEGCLAQNGKAVGIIPDFFDEDVVVATDLQDLIYVKTMSERKQMMEQLADAFVALPGSFGTMDELFEVITDSQLGLHKKPVVILNAFGYYDFIHKQIEHFQREGFLRSFHRDILFFAQNVDEIFTHLENFVYSNDPTWLDKHTKNS